MSLGALLLFVDGVVSFALVLTGLLLIRRRRWWGVRLVGLSFSLVLLIGGVAILAAGGLSTLPSTVAGVFGVGVGLALLTVVRLRWAMPSGWRGTI
jgi:hypothetical protein